MELLALEDLKEMTEDQIKDHIAVSYQTPRLGLDGFKILIAYESVGSWSCDSSSYFLLKDKKTKELFDVHGSHCSCYGFEEQWKPEVTTAIYLKSDKFYLPLGGYDEAPQGNKEAVNGYITKL